MNLNAAVPTYAYFFVTAIRILLCRNRMDIDNATASYRSERPGSRRRVRRSRRQPTLGHQGDA